MENAKSLDISKLLCLSYLSKEYENTSKSLENLFYLTYLYELSQKEEEESNIGVKSQDLERETFALHEYDRETNLIYAQQRWLDSETGSFTQEDGARDGLNWYSYCGGNPVNYVDPWGLIIAGVDKAPAKPSGKEKKGGGGGKKGPTYEWIAKDKAKDYLAMNPKAELTGRKNTNTVQVKNEGSDPESKAGEEKQRGDKASEAAESQNKSGTNGTNDGREDVKGGNPPPDDGGDGTGNGGGDDDPVTPSEQRNKGADVTDVIKGTVETEEILTDYVRKNKRVMVEKDFKITTIELSKVKKGKHVIKSMPRETLYLKALQKDAVLAGKMAKWLGRFGIGLLVADVGLLWVETGSWKRALLRAVRHTLSTGAGIYMGNLATGLSLFLGVTAPVAPIIGVTVGVVSGLIVDEILQAIETSIVEGKGD